MEEEKIMKKSHEKKERIVKKLAERIKNARTFMIASIKGLPSPQFQNIKKELRKHAKIKVAKKNILRRAIEELNKEPVLALEKYVQENCAFIISDLDGFELARLLSKNKNPIFAKAGQIADDDIEIKAGLTNLMPGPAISELGALGIQISVEEGKIKIKQSKIIARKGDKINPGVASLLQKLDIKPFSIGLEPIAVYDTETEKIYSDIKINSEEAAEKLREISGKALSFAKKISYYCRETIGYLLSKANANAKALDKLSPKEEEKVEESKEEVKEEKAEGKQEEIKEPKEETKTQELNKPEEK